MLPLPAPRPAGDDQRVGAAAGPLTRSWAAGRPVDVALTLGPLRRGRGDPTHRRTPGGAVWRTSRTPDGPGTVAITPHADGCGADAAAWGPGAPWLLDALPSWLGEGDDPSGFDPRHPLLRDQAHRHPGWRVPRTGRVLESFVPAVLEQKVTGLEAFRAWRDLLRWYGEPAPGPAPEGMRVVPDAATWTQVPSWDWHRAGVDGKRSRTVLAGARLAGRLEATLEAGHDDAERVLRLVPGVGVWTAAEVLQRAHGCADAVSFGDFHVPSTVVHALTGEPRADDDRLREVLEPWRGHRYRVVRLVEFSGVRKPAYGPRYAPHDFRRM